MKEIVKVLLQEGIDESMINRVLDLIEEEYEVVDEDVYSAIDKYVSDKDSKKYYKKVAQKQQANAEKSAIESKIGKRPEDSEEAKKAEEESILGKSWDDIDFTDRRTPEQIKYDDAHNKEELKRYIKNNRTKNIEGERTTKEKQFPTYDKNDGYRSYSDEEMEQNKIARRAKGKRIAKGKKV